MIFSYIDYLFPCMNNRLRVFQSRVLSRVFESKIDEVTGGCRKLHSEQLVLFAKYN
jgi:hypothetical protein